MYCNKFFRTEEEAKAFKKSHGGALYKNIKGSHTRQAYRVEAMMAVQDGWLRSTETRIRTRSALHGMASRCRQERRFKP